MDIIAYQDCRQECCLPLTGRNMQDEPRFYQDLDLAQIDQIVFDCDDTLYPASLTGYPRGTDKGLHQRIKDNIRNVVDQDTEMLAFLGIQKLDMPSIGTAFHKIVKHYAEKGSETLETVLNKFYDVEYNFNPDPALGSGLAGLKDQGIKLAIDTNGTAFNVLRVLQRHGIDETIFGTGIKDILGSTHGKGTPERAQEVIQRFDVANPARSLYVDDTPDVLKAMKEAGFRTIWINDTGKRLPDHMKSYIDAIYPSASMLTNDILSARLALDKKQQPDTPRLRYG